MTWNEENSKTRWQDMIHHNLPSVTINIITKYNSKHQSFELLAWLWHANNYHILSYQTIINDKSTAAMFFNIVLVLPP